MRKFLLILVVFALAVPATHAADPLEEYFYASGKIRVVVAVVTLVMLGLIAYVVWLDRRLKKIEKKK
ncbi:MAG: CcmD family protein [Flavobacteriales bacterium]|jgi:hypothetical protein